MRRRTLLSSAAGAFAATGGVRAADDADRADARSDLPTGRREVTQPATRIADVAFTSTASLIAPDGGPLTDPSQVAVYAQPSASNEDSDGAGDAVVYDTSPIPLAAVDGTVAGFGSRLVTNGRDFRYGNEEFLLNVWDDLVGSGTVLYDESHDPAVPFRDVSNFATYAENAGYTVSETTDLSADLSSADAVWIATPRAGFTNTELSELSSFVDDGGVVFLHDTADFDDADRTATLNDVASAVSAGFRFNDDQVIDFDANAGRFFQPTTNEFNRAFPYFDDRPGLGIARDTAHTVDVVSVTDGDTIDVAFDSGRVVPVRLVGIDTPETNANDRFETISEWEGIESESYLDTWGANASSFATEELSGATVDVSFDPAESGIFDPFGRLVAYVTYDATGDGTRNTVFNRRTVEEGYARVYHSGFSRFGSYLDAEATARSNGTGLWAQSDPTNSAEIRNRDVAELFVPNAEAIRSTTGTLDAARVPVAAESTASGSGGFVSYASSIPLVGVDADSRVAAVGGPMIDNDYEQSDGFPVDTSGYENFVFLTNLVNELSDTTGDVLIDGGHGQFPAEGGLTAEDTNVYQRFLEGVGITLDGVNTFSSATLSDARALLVTPGPDRFTASELDAIRSFRDGGGAVILLGNSVAGDAARDTLDQLAFALGSDLRVNAGSVTDGTNNLANDQTVLTTTAFDTSFPLFSAVGSGNGGGSSSGSITVASVNADAAGNDGDNLTDEYVVFENPESADLDLTGYAVEDAVGKRYEFPDGFVFTGGATVTLYTGSGTDTDTELYWGYGSPVWNNSGDTVFVFDDSGATVVEYSY